MLIINGIGYCQDEHVPGFLANTERTQKDLLDFLADGFYYIKLVEA